MAKMKVSKAFFAVTVMSVIIQLAMAKDYTIGDSDGWDTNIDYDAWASGKTFSVGDTVTFKYAVYHDVLEVSEASYKVCSATNALATYSGGSTTIKLTAAGTRYFICGIPRHCSPGRMHVKIDVSSSPSSSSSGSSPPSSPPPSPVYSPPPSPSPPPPSPTYYSPPHASPPPPPPVYYSPPMYHASSPAKSYLAPAPAPKKSKPKSKPKQKPKPKKKKAPSPAAAPGPHPYAKAPSPYKLKKAVAVSPAPAPGTSTGAAVARHAQPAMVVVGLVVAVLMALAL